MPEKNNASDSGFDLRARGFSKVSNGKIDNTTWFDEWDDKSFDLLPGERVLITTGVQIAQPNIEECETIVNDIQVRPRSGLALKYGITILNSPGTVDNEYRNDIGVILYNTDKYETFTINDGDRIAQMVFSVYMNIHNSYLFKVETFDDTTTRGLAGYGDSGVE